jgi:hypothetical protein
VVLHETKKEVKCQNESGCYDFPIFDDENKKQISINVLFFLRISLPSSASLALFLSQITILIDNLAVSFA